MSRRRWRRNRKATRGTTGHTDHLDYSDIATVLGDRWFLCFIDGESGPVFWVCWTASASEEDMLHRVDWTVGVNLLEKAELTIGLDKNGYAHVRWISVEARERHRELVRRRKAEYSRLGVRTEREYLARRAAESEYPPEPGSSFKWGGDEEG